MYHIPSFAGGYASRRAEGRLDLENYRTFQKETHNFIVQPSGPLVKRPAVKDIGEGLSELKGRWITMSNGEADDDIFLLTEGKIYRLTDGWLVEQDVENVAGAGYWQQYTDSELPDIQWVDIRTILPVAGAKHYIILAHESMVPQYFEIKNSTTIIWDDLDNLEAMTFPGTPATTSGTFCATGGSDCPGVVCLYQSRLIFARTTDDPGYIAASKVGSLVDFSYSGTPIANEGWQGYVTETADYYINWIVPWKTLSIGTNMGVWLLNDGNIDASSIEQFTWYGRQPTNTAVAKPIDANLLFAGTNGQTIFGMTFNEQESGYNIPNLTELADDVCLAGARILTYQSSPFQIMWILCADGTISAITYGHGRIAWHKHIVGAPYTEDILVCKYGGVPRLLVVNIMNIESPSKTQDGNYYWIAGMMDELKLNPNSEDDVHLDFYREFESLSLVIDSLTTGAQTYADFNKELRKNEDLIYCKITEGDDDWIDREFLIGDYQAATNWEYELLDVLGNAFDSSGLAGSATRAVTGFRTMFFWSEHTTLAEWIYPEIENEPNKYSCNYGGLYRNGAFGTYAGYYGPGTPGIILADTSQIIYHSGAVGVTIPSLAIPFSPFTANYNPIGVARVLIRLDDTYGFAMLTEGINGYIDVIYFDLNEVETFDTAAEPFSGIAEKDFQTAHSYEPRIVMFHDIPAPCVICSLAVDLGNQE